MHRCHPAGGFQLLLRGIGLGDAQIFLNGFVKQIGRLADHGDVFQQGGGVDVVHIHAAEPDRAAVFLPEPQQQLEKGRFPAAGFPDNADDLALFGVQVDIPQNRRFRVIRKREVLHDEIFKI